MLLNDNAIRDLCVAGVIAPFKVGQVREVEDSFGARKVVSYGVSSFGYDIRLATGSVRLFFSMPCA